VGICHVTGSEKNPYVFLQVSANAVPAHRHHEHNGRRDIIGVHSAAECPHAPATAAKGHKGDGDRDGDGDDDGHGGDGRQRGQGGHADADVRPDRRKRD
jgi:hypothetical protein